MLHRGTPHRPGRSTAEDGMSLIEVVVAMVVLAILAATVLGVILRAQATGVNNRARIAAANLAAREIDIVRDEFGRTDAAPREIGDQGVQTNANPLAGGIAGDPLVVDGTQYTVVRSTAWNITGDGASACEGGSLVDYPTLGVTVAVTWPGMGTTQPVVSHAQLAPTKGNGVPGTASYVAVSVVDSAGDPNPGRRVRVTSASESHTGLTDASGCAVIQVSPASTGTDYEAALTDSGYVDVNNSANPTKPVGTLTQGQLNSSVTFAYDRAASLKIRVLDGTGNLVDDDLASDSVITLSTVGATGDTVTSTPTLSGSTTTLGGLWPPTYGAYYGSAAPAGGYPTVAVAPGATGQLDVVLEAATGSITGMPAGTTSVIAAPGLGACTDSGAQVVDPTAFTLIPGSWTFYASGATFTCSPGPQGEAFDPGPNDGLTWGTSTLRVTGAPDDGVLWALNTTKSPSALTTCPEPSAAAATVDVNGARTGPVTLPAGDWYVYRTDGPATGGTCLGTPTGQYPKNVGYGTNTVLNWVEVTPTASLTVTDINKSRYLVLSTTNDVSCGWYSVSASGDYFVAGATVSRNASLTLSVDVPTSGVDTWYATIWRNNKRLECDSIGAFQVGPGTTSLSKPDDSSWVGP